MALQSSTLVDVVDGTQTLTYTLSGSTVDQITYSSNSVTFSTISSFNLDQNDTVLYAQYLNQFLNLLVNNFPVVQSSRALTLPVSTFEIELDTVGVEHLYYIQTSLGSGVYNTNYVPTASAASFAARTQITITLQEFFLCCNLQAIYAAQVAST